MFSPKQSSCLLQPETIQGIKQAHTALYATTPASHNARSPHPCFRTSCVDRTLWPGTSRLRFAGVRHAFQPRELELLSPRTVAGTVNSFHPRMHSFPRYHSQHPLRLSNTTIVKTCQQYEPCATYAVAVLSRYKLTILQHSALVLLMSSCVMESRTSRISPRLRYKWHLRPAQK